MSANAVVRARIDEHIKEEATAVLAAMGLTVSDAFRIMLTLSLIHIFHSFLKILWICLSGTMPLSRALAHTRN